MATPAIDSEAVNATDLPASLHPTNEIGTTASPAATARNVALLCMPNAGRSRKPAARLPHTAPIVLDKYRTPARRPTDCSARWIIALANGKLNPIRSAGSPTSNRIGLALNHNSVSARARPDSTR